MISLYKVILLFLFLINKNMKNDKYLKIRKLFKKLLLNIAFTIEIIKEIIYLLLVKNIKKFENR